MVNIEQLPSAAEPAEPTIRHSTPPESKNCVEIVNQHDLEHRKFFFLTTHCCHVVNQLRPVDILCQLLFDASGPDSTAVRAFFQLS
jgi:hypothetical protein